jgi:pimeloyl-ACP methyl ester carboxylesterase
MNSFAEREIVGPVAERAGVPIVFWNEPSRLRPEGAAYDPVHPYLGWVSSLEQAVGELAQARGPINLIAHSFAGGPALEIARKHPGKVRSLTLVATAIDPWKAALRIMKLAESDFRAAGDDRSASELEARRKASRSIGDEAMVEGLLSALRDPRLFAHYYFDPTRMQAALAALARAGVRAGADLEAFAAIFRDMRSLSVTHEDKARVDLPALRLVGEHERVIDVETEALLHMRYLTHLQSQSFAGAAHFLHLDQPEAFVARLSSFLLELTTESRSQPITMVGSAGSAGISPSV